MRIESPISLPPTAQWQPNQSQSNVGSSADLLPLPTGGQDLRKPAPGPQPPIPGDSLVTFEEKIVGVLEQAGVAVRTHDSDYGSADDITDRADGAAILITKEVPVSGDAIRGLPESVELICEAGTGYNNIDLEAARAKGITVCNIPEYSTDAMAQLVITGVLNFSAAIVHQQRLLARGDTSNFQSLQLVRC